MNTRAVVTPRVFSRGALAGPVAVAGAAGAAGAPAAAASAIRGDCRRMDGGCAARGSPCSETSAHYGASDARDGARVTLRVPPVYSRGGHLGVAPGVLERGYLGVAPGVLEGPRYRGSGPLWMTAARTWFRASADGEGGGVHSWARQLPRDSPQRTCVPTQLMCMGVCASHRGRRRSRRSAPSVPLEGQVCVELSGVRVTSRVAPRRAPTI